MDEYFIKTENRMGFALKKLDYISAEFISYSSKFNDWALEIGSAFGNIIDHAVNHSLKICCNDICKNHIDIIRNRHGENPDIEYLVGDFLTLNFNKTYTAILISRVLHFLNPAKLEQAFSIFSKKLNDDGKLFITVETPYLGNWKNFLPEYMERLEANVQYAGYISDTRDYETEGYQSSLPSEVNWLDKIDFIKLSNMFNFEIEHMEYIDRKGYFPDSLLLDGRESLGIIMRKKNNV